MMKLNIYFLKKATEHLRAEKEVKDFYAQLVSPTLVVLIHSKSRASQTSVAPIFTASGKKFGNFRCTCLGFNTFLSTSLVLVLTKSVLHQCFGCWSKLHWNLTELAEILGENLKESDLSQMCT